MKKDDQEIEIEEFIPEDGEGNTQSQVSRLKEKLKKTEEKAKEYLDGWQRAQADFINLRKRDEEEMRTREKYSGALFVKELFPIIHSLEIASATDKDISAILSQLNSALKKIGVVAIDPQNETFNPSLHEAVKTTLTTDPDLDHKVAEVLEKGYLLHDRVLRPAKVAVYSHE